MGTSMYAEVRSLVTALSLGERLRLLEELARMVRREMDVPIMNSQKESSKPFAPSERGVFLGLPLEERRRILEEQAKQMTSHYARNPEWKELSEGDIIEY